MRRTRLRLLALALAGLPLLTACAEGDDVLLRAEIGPDLFARYVSLGSSITAGVMSGAILAPLQLQAYPELLADRAGAQFTSPLLASPPGTQLCTQPMVAPLTYPPGQPPANPFCVRLVTPRIINNLAIPFETIGDMVHGPTDPTTVGLHTIMIGNRTQLQAMREYDPTLLSVWIGNNDALPAALQGNPALLTPEALFAARVDTVAAAIRDVDPQGVVLVGVLNSAAFAPLLQPGAFYFLAWAGAAAQGQPSPFGRPVGPDCAPGTAGASNLVSLAILGTSPAQVPVISCAESAPLVLSQAEATAVTARVAAFNAKFRAVADANQWIFLDPNTVFLPLLADPARIRRCQGLAALGPTATPQQIGAAIASTCPNLQNRSVGFGSVISLDGVHPSAAGHVLMANEVAARLNERFGLSLPTS